MTRGYLGGGHEYGDGDDSDRYDDDGRYCEDCGDEMDPGRRRVRCKNCGKLVCPWCYHHVHLLARVIAA